MIRPAAVQIPDRPAVQGPAAAVGNRIDEKDAAEAARSLAEAIFAVLNRAKADGHPE